MALYRWSRARLNVHSHQSDTITTAMGVQLAMTAISNSYLSPAEGHLSLTTLKCFCVNYGDQRVFSNSKSS